MSTTVDQRVVEMRFDNKHFESNVSTTMSTLDKLKQSLRLADASKGLENVSAAAKKVDFSGMTNGIDAVQVKFSYLQASIQHQLNRIVDSAFDAGKRMVSALTIDPIKTGFSEYETQINAVQTILANTESKGTTLDQVNQALETLNKYADMTIYNFTEMTRNIGTFTAAGIDLDTSVNAIQGIANLAAVSGSTSQQASTAMYQLSQALAAGTVKLMDWNSVVNAGMGGQVFQDALKETARVHGIAIDDMIAEQGSFRETLSEGWITSEILTETLEKFTMATEGLTEAEIEANREKLRGLGYTEEQIEGIFKLGNTATNAATKVKTFTQLWDVMKEAAQSGWAQTWKIIVGDFEEAKNLLTPLSDFFTGVINNISDFRNNILKLALGSSPFEGLTKTLEKVTGVTETLTGVTKDYGVVVEEVLGGKWGNHEARYKALTEAGYDWAKVQNMVNEKLGSSVRHTSDFKEAQEDANKTQSKTINQLVRMSDAQLESLGFTKKEIDALRELKEQSEKTGIPIEDLIKDLDQLNGRSLLINSFKNIASSLGDAFSILGAVWKDTFPPKSIEERADALYNMIAAFHKFTESLNVFFDAEGNLTETGEKLGRTFDGIVAVIDIFATITGGALRVAFKVLTSVLGYFNLDVLDLTAIIGDVLVGFRDWLEAIFNIDDAIAAIIPFITNAANAVRKWFKAFKESDTFTSFTAKLSKAVTAIKDWFNSLKDSENLPRDIAEGIGRGLATAIKYIKDLLSGGFADSGRNIVSGLIEGLKGGVSAVVSAIVGFATTLIESFKDTLGIHSPSTVFMAIGGFIIAGLLIGIKNFAPNLWGALTDVGNTAVEMFRTIIGKAADFLKNVDFGTLLAGALSIGVLTLFFKVAGIIKSLVSPAEALTGALESLGGMFDAIGDSFKVKKWETIGDIVLKIAIAIGILAASVWVLAQVPTKQLWISVGAVATLGVVLGGLAAGLMLLDNALSKGNVIKGKKNSSLGKLSWTLIAIGGSLLLMALAVKKLSTIDAGGAEVAIDILTKIILSVAGLAAAMGAISSIQQNDAMGKVGGMLLKMAIALGVMVLVIKLIDKLDENAIIKGLGVITLLGTMCLAFVAMSALAGEHASKAGSMLLKMSVAMLIMVGVIKLISYLRPDEIARGIATIWAIGGIFMALTAVSAIAGRNASQAGSMILKMSIAFVIMVAAVKLIAGVTDSELDRGLSVIKTMGGIFTAMLAISLLAGQNASQAGSMLFKMSLAIGILVGCIFLLTLMDQSKLGLATTVVAVLETLMGGLIAVTYLAKDVKTGTLATLVAGIVVLVGAVIALSFIEPERLGIATACMSALMGMFAVMMAAMSKVKPDSLLKPLAQMIGVVVLLAAVLGVLGQFDYNSDLLTVAGSLSILMGAMAGVMFAISKIKANKNLDKSILALAKMAIPLAAFMGVLALMPIIPQTTVDNIGMIVGVMGAMTLLLAAVSLIDKFLGKGGAAQNGVLALTAMAIPLIAFGAILSIMPAIPAHVSENILMLVGVMTAMTLLLVPLTILGNFGVSAIIGVGLLTAMAIPLMAFIAVLHFMPEIPAHAVENIGMLVGVMTAMTLLLVPLTLIGLLGPAALVGAVSLTAMAGSLWVFAFAISNIPEIPEHAIAVLGTLVIVMERLSDILFKIAIVAPLALMGVAAMAGLEALLVSFGVLAVAIGALMEKFPAIQDFVTNGISILIQLADGLGQCIGAFITAIATSVMDLLPQLGASLSSFAVNIMPFISIMKMVDEDVLAGIAIVAGAIFALTAADLINGIMDFMGIGIGWSGLGTELSMFAMSILPFLAVMSSIKPEVFEGVSAMAEAMLILTAADLVSQITSFLTGESSLSSFGAEIAAFGPHMATFANSVAGLNEDSLNAMKISAEAGKTLAEMAKTLPKEGGWLQNLLGESDAGSFGAQLKVFGSGLVEYATSVEGLNVEAIENSVPAAQSLSDLANSLPDTGGVWADFFGDNAMDTFGVQLVSFGQSLMAYGQAVIGIDSYTEAIASSVTAATSIKDLAASLPDSGGWKATILGDNDMSTFGTQIVEFARALLSYSMVVTGQGGIDVGAIENSVNAGKSLAKLGDVIPTSGGFVTFFTGDNDMATFGEQIKKFGSAMVDYGATVAGINTSKVTSSVNAAKKLAELAKDLDGVDASAVSNFANSLKDIGADGINSFVSAFEDSHTKASNAIAGLLTAVTDKIKSKENQFNIAGSKLMANFSTGINEGKSAVTTTINTMLTNLVSAVENGYTSLYSAGKYVVDGFAAGITAQTWKAEARAKAMAEAAVEAAKDELDVNSPSKVFRALGYSVPEGFAMGIDKLSGMAVSSSRDMADTAIDTVRSSISRIADTINSDVDSQPTIRPVLDLSEVEAGAGTIGGMFGLHPSVGVLSNINAIGSMMGNRQNGANSDVISAIKDLGRRIGNSTGNTYNVNGVTYDDGSNVSEAVKSLVRAARIERRT